MTNNHVLNDNFFKTNKEIKIEYNHSLKLIQIDKRKIYTSKQLDYTCVEIYDSDYIKQFFHINPQTLINDIGIFKNEDIFILQYPLGKNISFAGGKIISIYGGNQFLHNCSTLEGSSGSPIILRSDSSVIGLHYGSFTENEKEKKNPLNLSTSILAIIKSLIIKISGNQLITNNIYNNNFMDKNIPIIENNSNMNKIFNDKKNNVINNNNKIIIYKNTNNYNKFLKFQYTPHKFQ